MLSTSRSRVRALAVAGMAAVVAAVGAVTFQASAAEVAVPAAVGPDARQVAVPGIASAIKPPKGSRPIGAYMVATGTQNVHLVVVVDLVADRVYGHHLLDLNAKYGVVPQPRHAEQAAAADGGS